VRLFEEKYQAFESQRSRLANVAINLLFKSWPVSKLRRMKNLLLFSIVLLAGIETGRAQTIAAWNFENDTVAVNNSPTPSTADPYGTATAVSIGMGVYPTPNNGTTTDDVLVGATGDTGVNTVADTTNIGRIRAQGTKSSPANGWSSAAPIGSQGAQFLAPTTSLGSSLYTGVTVSFDWYSTTQGEANLQLEYTTNGGTTWNNVALTLGGNDAGLQVLTNSTSANTVMGSYVSDNLTQNASAGQDWFTGLTATIINPSVLNDPGFGIELVNASTGADDINTQGAALNNTSGNWRFDNVSITADAAPEPGTWALLLASLGLLAAFAKVSRKRGNVTT
jgi:hypothetical protein